MDVRRVVTGHDGNGKAVFVSDEKVAPLQPRLLPGSEFHRLWGGDEAPKFPDDGSQPSGRNFFPPIGGYRFLWFTLPPAGAAASESLDPEAVAAEMEEKLPGLVSYMEPDAPGMHTTDTIDFEVVLKGEVWLELDDGAEVHLKPGDTVVQNGTRHAWHNKGSEPAVLAAFIVGAHHDKIG